MSDSALSPPSVLSPSPHVWSGCLGACACLHVWVHARGHTGLHEWCVGASAHVSVCVFILESWLFSAVRLLFPRDLLDHEAQQTRTSPGHCDGY